MPIQVNSLVTLKSQPQDEREPYVVRLSWYMIRVAFKEQRQVVYDSRCVQAAT